MSENFLSHFDRPQSPFSCWLHAFCLCFTSSSPLAAVAFASMIYDNLPPFYGLRYICIRDYSDRMEIENLFGSETRCQAQTGNWTNATSNNKTTRSVSLWNLWLRSTSGCLRAGRWFLSCGIFLPSSHPLPFWPLLSAQLIIPSGTPRASPYYQEQKPRHEGQTDKLMISTTDDVRSKQLSVNSKWQVTNNKERYNERRANKKECKSRYFIYLLLAKQNLK